MDQDGYNIQYLTDGKQPRADAALLADPAAPHLPQLRGRQSAGLSARSRLGPAAAARQLWPDDLLAALLARRRHRRLLGRAGRHDQHLRAADRRQPADAAHLGRGDRHLAELLARRLAHRLRERPRRQPAALRHGRGRRRGAAHLLRRRLVLDPGLVAQGRPDRLYPPESGGQFQIGIMAPDGSQRAHPRLELPRRRPDLGPQRPRHHVLPRSRRRQRPAALLGRHLGPQRTADPDGDLMRRDPAWSPLRG